MGGMRFHGWTSCNCSAFDSSHCRKFRKLMMQGNLMKGALPCQRLLSRPEHASRYRFSLQAGTRG